MTVLGLGDSITEGPGDSTLGVLPRPWSHWLALALDAPFHGLARPGATAPEVVRDLLPRAARRRYGVACIGVGTNDVRAADFSLSRCAAAIAALLDGVDAERVCVATIPVDLGRPRAGGKVALLNAEVRRLAAERGAAVVALDDLRGWRLVMPDAVHPTALGQVEVADRAAAALGLDVRPSSLVDPHRSGRAALRYAVTRHAPMLGRELRRRAVESRTWRAPGRDRT
ncbi:GDSL-type esterase/lipase family protein [Conexibacter sp. SYSU D00693]|uniref:SGNH/GDSL hydrolase family protein n=1 Tax=Conexibacter sp. SYSU D00693 TaxID=2812560 RepID=UPI00196B888B|nr:GDSL-type esterase/lipase family protein [Conexibacter sp. SYSU D00693]